MNIYEASKLAMIQAVEKLSIVPSYLLIDAMTLDLPIQQEKIIKGMHDLCRLLLQVSLLKYIETN